MRRKGFILLVALVLGVGIFSGSALAKTEKIDINRDNVGLWAAYAAANTPGATQWAQDLFPGASELEDVDGQVRLNDRSGKFQVKMKKLPSLPASIASPAGKLFSAYFLVILYTVTGSSDVFMAASQDMQQWIGYPGPWDFWSHLWLIPVLPKTNGKANVTEKLGGAIDLDQVTIVGALLYGLDLTGRDATLIAASEVNP